MEVFFMTYEEMTARLETILKTLEQGQVPLADIMTLFQEAKKLSQDIEKLLAQYEAIFNSSSSSSSPISPISPA